MVSRRLRARPANRLLLAIAVLAWVLPHLCVPAWCQAQASSPITSSGLNTTVTKSATTFEITGGTRPGNGPNLFHSFGEFGVPANHVANFLNDSGLATTNILGRVTGGNPSNIFGTIQTTGFGTANLFVMNPAGIVFGPGASLNVGGAVTFTTTADLTGMSCTFTAVPGRRYMCWVTLNVFQQVSTDLVSFYITGPSGSGVKQLIASPRPGDFYSTVDGSIIQEGLSGSVTLKVARECLGGGGYAQVAASAQFPAQFVIMDVGPYSAPA